MPRLLLPPDRWQQSLVQLQGEPHRYLSRVLRLRAGDRLQLFDGQGGEAEGRIERSDRRETVVFVGPRRHVVATGPIITLFQVVPKGERMDWLVQKCSELGLSRLVPLCSARSVMRPEAGRLTRWRAIAEESARQCERSHLLTIGEPTSVTEMFAGAGSLTGSRFVLAERQTGLSLPRALQEAEQTVNLLVGPEGGWTPEEMVEAETAGFVAVGLGPRILRAETAGMVAVAVVQALKGGMEGAVGAS